MKPETINEILTGWAHLIKDKFNTLDPQLKALSEKRLNQCNECGLRSGSVCDPTKVAPHTVTSSVDYGETFDSSLISAGETFTLDTTELEIGEYEYLCIVHPWMIATLVVEAPKEATKIIIPEGAAIPEEGKIFYDPETINITTGTTIEWINEDAAMHTATSGSPTNGVDGVFDSQILNINDTYQFTFTDAGNYDYYCILHPWMLGTINVE